MDYPMQRSDNMLIQQKCEKQEYISEQTKEINVKYSEQIAKLKHRHENSRNRKKAIQKKLGSFFIAIFAIITLVTTIAASVVGFKKSIIGGYSTGKGFSIFACHALAGFFLPFLAFNILAGCINRIDKKATESSKKKLEDKIQKIRTEWDQERKRIEDALDMQTSQYREAFM